MGGKTRPKNAPYSESYSKPTHRRTKVMLLATTVLAMKATREELRRKILLVTGQCALSGRKDFNNAEAKEVDALFRELSLLDPSTVDPAEDNDIQVAALKSRYRDIVSKMEHLAALAQKEPSQLRDERLGEYVRELAYLSDVIQRVR